jgi:di/tricarboxylate transporter
LEFGRIGGPARVTGTEGGGMTWTRPKVLLLGIICLAIVYWNYRNHRSDLYSGYITGKAVALGLIAILAVVMSFWKRR